MKRAAICLVLFSILALGTSGFPRGARAVELDEPAPEISLPGMRGGKFRLSELKGKVVLVGFWATWCPPCREEMPTMERVYNDYKERGFVVVGVNTDRDDAGGKVSGFIRELKVTFPIAMDPGHVSKRAYKVRGMPQNFLIDRKGKVARIVYGSLNWAGGPARGVIEELLNKK